MDAQNQLIERIEAFLAECDMTATKFGQVHFNDSAFVFRLRSGRSPTLRTVDRIDRILGASVAAAD